MKSEADLFAARSHVFETIIRDNSPRFVTKSRKTRKAAKRAELDRALEPCAKCRDATIRLSTKRAVMKRSTRGEPSSTLSG
jgi:hypothetical protein